MSTELQHFSDALTLSGGYNTALVSMGASLLGAACGLIGLFAMLRGRALLSDAVAHATLPGLVGAFLLATMLGLEGKSTPVLLIGAAVGGLSGAALVAALTRFTRLSEDATIGIALSTLFGLGVVMLSYVQTIPGGGQAGLTSYLLGQTAAMRAGDAMLMGAVALVATLVAVLLFKELRLGCFDPRFAASLGRSPSRMDAIEIALVVLVVTAGIGSVGLVLVVAMLVIPAASARFWSDRLATLAVLAAALGALCGYLGSAVSAAAPRLPTGAIIVLIAGAVFGASALLAPKRGLLARLIGEQRLRIRVLRDHAMRAAFESIEARDGRVAAGASVDLAGIASRSGWSPMTERVMRSWARSSGLIDASSSLTDAGYERAAKITRRHRLWELFLVTHADVAASHVHDAADLVEHALDDELVASLERTLEAEGRLPDAVDLHGGGR